MYYSTVVDITEQMDILPDVEISLVSPNESSDGGDHSLSPQVNAEVQQQEEASQPLLRVLLQSNAQPSSQITAQEQQQQQEHGQASSSPQVHLDPPGATPRARQLQLLRQETVRLGTFRNWPNEHVTKERLARAGFFYFNDRDRVQCAFCLGIVERWEPFDVPILEHERLFRNCPFILGLPVGNIPSVDIDVASLLPVPRVTRHTSPADALNLGIQYGRMVTTHRSIQDWEGVTETSKTDDGPISTKLKGYELSAVQKSAFTRFLPRGETFGKWPVSVGLTGFEMACAGFFYTQIADQVACIDCGLHLRAWKSHHNPLLEHSSWSPDCTFVKKLKDLSIISSKRVNAAAAAAGQETGASVNASPEHYLCKICFEKTCELLFLPCAHLCVCLTCSVKVAKCPLCRASITAFVKVFI